MPTRYYITGPPADGSVGEVMPPPDPLWTTGGTSTAGTYPTTTSPNVAGANGGRGFSTSVGVNTDYMVARYVSEPLGPQTLSGTFKGQVRARETNAALNARSQILAKIVSNDGQTLRGYLYAGDTVTQSTNPASEFGTAYANRKYPRNGPVTVTPVQVQNGDRLIIEVGYRIHSTSTTSYAGWVYLASGHAGDLPEDETTTTDLNPWVEFSHDIVPYQPAQDLSFEDEGFLYRDEDFSIRMPGQVVFPNGLISTGQWRTETGGTLVHTSIDETPLDFSDYAQSGELTATPDVFEVALSDPLTPNLKDSHYVGYTYSKDVSSSFRVDLTVTLLQGTTTIATWTHTDISNEPASIVHELTLQQATSITNYADFRLRLSAVRV